MPAGFKVQMIKPEPGLAARERGEDEVDVGAVEQWLLTRHPAVDGKQCRLKLDLRMQHPAVQQRLFRRSVLVVDRPATEAEGDRDGMAASSGRYVSRHSAA